MMEINFLEIKKINIVPFFLVLILLFLLSSAAGILYWQQQTAQHELDEKQQKLTENQSVEVEIVNLQQIQEERLQLSEQINGVNEVIFPSVALKDQIISLLPSTSTISNFNFDYQNGVILDVQLNNLEQIATYTSTLTEQSYVTNLVVHNISQSANEDASYYDVSIEMAIDHNAWTREAQNNED